MIKPIKDGAKKLTQQSAITSIRFEAQIVDGNAIKTLSKLLAVNKQRFRKRAETKEEVEVCGFTEVKKVKIFW